MEFKIKERILFEVDLERKKNRRKNIISLIRNWIKTDMIENGESKNLDLKRYKSENMPVSLYPIFSASLSNNKIIGACICELYGEGLLRIDNLIVRKEYRRQGVGLKLVSNVVDYAKKNKIYNMQCISLSINKESKKFLKKAGFRKVGKLRRYVGKKDYYLWEYLP